MPGDNSIGKIIIDSQKLLRESKISLPNVQVDNLSITDAINKMKYKDTPTIKSFDKIFLKIDPKTQNSELKVINKTNSNKLKKFKEGLYNKIVKDREEAVIRRQELYKIDNENKFKNYYYEEVDEKDAEKDVPDEEFEYSDDDSLKCDSEDPETKVEDYSEKDDESEEDEILEKTDNDEYTEETEDEIDNCELESENIEELIDRVGKSSEDNTEQIKFDNDYYFDTKNKKINDRKLKLMDFVDNEVEVSGSDSGDEVLDEIDEYNPDWIDDEEIGDDEHQRLAKINSKLVADEDEEVLIRIKDQFLPDGDTEGDIERHQSFRWKECDLTQFDGDNAVFGDSEEEEDNSTQWRIKRFARESFIKSQNSNKDGEINENSTFLNSNSQSVSGQSSIKRMRGSFIGRISDSWLDGMCENSNSGTLTNPILNDDKNCEDAKRVRKVQGENSIGFFGRFSKK